jgi:hypothetical protein
MLMINSQRSKCSKELSRNEEFQEKKIYQTTLSVAYKSTITVLIKLNNKFKTQFRRLKAFLSLPTSTYIEDMQIQSIKSGPALCRFSLLFRLETRTMSRLICLVLTKKFPTRAVSTTRMYLPTSARFMRWQLKK